MNKKFWAALLVLVLGSSIFYLSSIGNAPDEDVTFERTVPSKLDAGYFDQVFQQIPKWHQWFYEATDSNELNGLGEAYPLGHQKLQVHAIVRMNFNPHHGENSKFSVTFEVVDYVPQKLLKLKIVNDSKNHLLKNFNPLFWTIEILPEPEEAKSDPKKAGYVSLVKGTLTGRTATFRSRIYSHLIPSIFLNQVFFPNLLVLAEINNPLAVVPYPESQ